MTPSVFVAEDVARGQQRNHRLGDAPYQPGVALEQVLVEVLAADLAGPERKRAGEMTSSVHCLPEGLHGA